MQTLLSQGTVAPDFKLHVTADQTLTLSELKGNPVILAFYPADWSPVCSDEMALFNEVLPEFRKHKAELLGISVDSYWCHNAFAKNYHIHYPLSLILNPREKWPKYTGLIKTTRVSAKGSFVIDKNGVIAWSYLSPAGENPGADGVLEALEKLTGVK